MSESSFLLGEGIESQTSLTLSPIQAKPGNRKASSYVNTDEAEMLAAKCAHLPPHFNRVGSWRGVKFAFASWPLGGRSRTYLLPILLKEVSYDCTFCVAQNTPRLSNIVG